MLGRPVLLVAPLLLLAGCGGGTPARCSLPFEIGPCNGALRVFAHVGGSCVEEIYGGCQGNDNRFFTIEECRAVCQGQPNPNGCPSGLVRQQICIACGPTGGCGQTLDACATPCDATATCPDPATSFCIDGVCQTGGCI